MNNWLPDSLQDLTEEDIAGYLHDVSPLGALLRRPAFRRAIAEDLVLAKLRPIIDLPDFMDGEAQLIKAWADQQPTLFNRLLEVAKSDLTAFSPFESEDQRKRLDVRLAAYRRMAVLWFGRETYLPCPELGGDVYVEIEVDGHADRMKIGRVTMAFYESDEKLEREFIAFCGNRANLEKIERTLVPGFDPFVSPEDWSAMSRARRAVAELRKFECTNRFPVFPSSVVFDPKEIPAGFAIRPSLVKVLSEGEDLGVYGLVLELGIAPCLSQPALAYLALHEQEIVEAAIDHGLIPGFMRRSPAIRELVRCAKGDQGNQSFGRMRM